MDGFFKAGRVSDIPVGTVKAIEIDGQPVVLCNTGEGIHAVADVCTHDGAPIRTGRLFGHTIMCSRHGAKFDVRDGRVLGPPAIVPIDTYEVRVDGDDLFVRVT